MMVPLELNPRISLLAVALGIGLIGLLMLAPGVEEKEAGTLTPKGSKRKQGGWEPFKDPRLMASQGTSVYILFDFLTLLNMTAASGGGKHGYCETAGLLTEVSSISTPI